MSILRKSKKKSLQPTISTLEGKAYPISGIFYITEKGTFYIKSSKRYKVFSEDIVRRIRAVYNYYRISLKKPPSINRSRIQRICITRSVIFHLSRSRYWFRRIWKRILSIHQREGIKCHSDLQGAQARSAFRESLLHADSPHLYSGSRRISVETHIDEWKPAQRRTYLGS